MTAAKTSAVQRSSGIRHAHVGAVLAEKIFGVKDRSVLEAIRCHSAAGLKMGKLAEIIYLSDKIEPGRKFPGISAIRAAAGKDLKRAMRLTLEGTIDYLKRSKKRIHPLTGRILGKYKKYV